MQEDSAYCELSSSSSVLAAQKADQAYRDLVLAALGEISSALAALVRSQEALALALTRQGRQGTLRVRIEAPSVKRRRKRRTP
jgi:hypothetical protein